MRRARAPQAGDVLHLTLDGQTLIVRVESWSDDHQALNTLDYVGVGYGPIVDESKSADLSSEEFKEDMTAWEALFPSPSDLSRLSLSKRVLTDEFSPEEWLRLVAPKIKEILDTKVKTDL